MVRERAIEIKCCNRIDQRQPPLCPDDRLIAFGTLPGILLPKQEEPGTIVSHRQANARAGTGRKGRSSGTDGQPT